ncbi:Protein of unknown function (DUF3405) [Teratosphaeria destructans]|uniref:Major facilitator superfamily transporter n=1 Tax=Teratosphaeria destructans TaxID=418781 RepID=A0A9W7W2D0_9PEZI|nr:Protein of unknown function (DUF3405) [Teratosphaeria destructans]
MSRQSRAYRSFSGALIDPEKRRNSNDSDSPDLIDSAAPMLPGHNQQSKPSFAYHLPRRRFTRYFTLAISAILILLILYLVRSSSNSDALIKSGLQKPPPPPPAWEQFPFLKRYHGGIRSLVGRDENQPEYPAGSDEEELRILQEAALARKKQDESQPEDGGFQKRRKRFESVEEDLEDAQSRSSAFAEKSVRFDPFQNSGHKAQNSSNAIVKCYLHNETELAAPQLLAYRGVTAGFPDPIYGSYELFGLRNDVCFERFGRLGPYGYGYSRKFGGSGAGLMDENEDFDAVWDRDIDNQIDWRTVRWGEAQKDCWEKNKHRFVQTAHVPRGDSFMASGGPLVKREGGSSTRAKPKQDLLKRTAVIIRTWTGFEYDPEDVFYLRALINELTIQSGGEYVVHFLIHVKDEDLPIWSDEAVYQRVLDEALPEEFRGMGTLWSEKQMSLLYSGLDESLYRDLPVHGAYRSTYMPVQYFAHMHPEYDFFWHWEMDVRYTGHYYHLLHQVSEWAKKQPRKGLWERNGRFYVPSEHGSWEDFRQMVRVQTEHGTAAQSNMYTGNIGHDAAGHHPLDEASRRPETPIWGGLPPSGPGNEIAESFDGESIHIPHAYDDDNYSWGVGEEADFITFNPLFDPHLTNWILAEDVTGYNTTGTDGSKTFPPRRTAIITASRLSRRLLETMHRETSSRRHTMFSEMWPGSCALHHGYKAVYAPHPVYIDRAWPTSYLAAIFNNGRNGAAGGSRTSVFSDERQHNFLGTTWYYHAGFAGNLWKRWLGYRVDNDGGEAWEKAGEGRMCVPAMLLHPVKQVDLVWEHEEETG